MSFLYSWLFIGVIASLLATLKCRPRGLENIDSPFLIIAGIFLGPVTFVLVILYYFRELKNKPRDGV